jgi:hypothetical protein
VYPEEELLGEIKDQYHRDPFFKKVLDAPKEFRNFVLKDGIMRVKLHDRTTICIPDIKVGDRRLQETIISQAHSLLAHSVAVISALAGCEPKPAWYPS